MTPSPIPVPDRLHVHPGPLLLSGVHDDAGLAAHRARWGELPAYDVRALADLAGTASLRGRGGAGFPFARKLTTADAGRRPVVVVNAAEGEPASAKDSGLLLTVPHLVLDGAAVAARALGARSVHVVLPGDRPRVRDAVATALAERHDRRLRWRTSVAGARFVSGQSRAVVEMLDGRPGLPVTSWRPEAVTGVGGRPTLLSNAETWAHLGALALGGLSAYLRLGTATEPGTRLLTVTTPGSDPHVHEVEHGALLSDVLPPGGTGSPVLIGGFHGGWAPWEVVRRAVVSPSTLAAMGVPLGAGVVHVPAHGACPLDLTARITAHLASQSAGRCGPCFNGLPALADAVVGMGRGRPGSRERAEQLTGLLPGRGACAHPDGTVRLVRSLLEQLPEEVEAHAVGSCAGRGPWPAGGPREHGPGAGLVSTARGRAS